MKYLFSIVITTTMLLSACSNNAKEQALIKQQAIAAVKDSLKLDSFKRAEVKKQEDAKIAAQVREEKRTLLLAERNEAASQPSHNYSNEASAPAKKKGWSEAAKGTAIGAGAGALGGALIDKKKGRGAIIGGVVGAGAGYLIGRDKDRKSGRVQPKN
ncbi:YMGG-like glycine zipper-containing protein [Pedobacter foliorum]|uniref:YMGG-like glycine zipper-containing protein n=1 Tax=Pedobacter foliorum TaxID=2739058 RepID=UPI0015645300|nr:YMGG-like glycine zipper-containing protein [Pedobacter foliorum]NRF38203.1 glycine zipper 2TM domain-containing protein [Pedobacter foliorum]